MQVYALTEILKLFFTLGVSAFGGPAAHIAMIHREVVEKRKWMKDEHFLDLIGATSLIPGPNSTEMVIHCGFHRGGVPGLFIAGISFIFPACLLTGLLAYFYQLGIQYPQFQGYLIGIKPIVIILILQAIKKLWAKAIKDLEYALIAGVVFVMGFLGVPEAFALLGGGALGLVYFRLKGKLSQTKSVDILSIFWVFTKIGSILFGSGYVLIAYLQDEIVDQRAWLTSAQIADAVAIGQFTPGPVLSTSTFIGYLLGGGWGAMASSVGIFLPSFLFVWFLNPLIPKMRQSRFFSELLDAINAGAIGLMAYALLPLGKVAFTGIEGILIFIIAGVMIWIFPKISSLKLVAFGLASGALCHHFL